MRESDQFQKINHHFKETYDENANFYSYDIDNYSMSKIIMFLIFIVTNDR